jgi:hypothetical protein
MDRNSLRKWIRHIEDEEFPAVAREEGITIAMWQELCRTGTGAS